MIVIVKFGEKVRRLREARGLSQSQLAALLGLSESSKGYISELERGKKRPSVELVLGLAVLFNVSTDYLLRDEWEHP